MEENKNSKIEEIREVIVEKKIGFNYAEVAVIMVITLILGGFGGAFIASFNKKSNHINRITKKANISEFLETYDKILDEYYDSIDEDELLEAGMNGMFEYLDKYSVYMNKEQTESFNEQVNGKYTGVGVEIILNKDNNTEIVRIFKGSPADLAGLHVGDVFKKVDNEDVLGKGPSEISSMIKGSEKNSVKVVVIRDGKDLEFELKIKEVIIDTVSSKVFNNNGKKVGYINVSIFSLTTYEQFLESVEKLEKDKIDSLIIDVRGNSGGYLTTVTDMLSLFLSDDKVIYQLDTKGEVEKVYAKGKNSKDYKVAVLIDNNSASASEILAGAFQESYGAIIVGTNSYGKGTVQKAYTLPSGATVKYTFQKWLTPNGNWINEVGIKPDIEVELGKEYLADPSDENDAQLQRAIKELSK